MRSATVKGGFAASAVMLVAVIGSVGLWAQGPPSSVEPVSAPGGEKPTRPEGADELQERTVSLAQAVHFTDVKGQDVVVGPGSYRAEAEDMNRLRLVSTETGESVAIDAVNFTHQQTVESPVAITVPDPKDPDVLHLALLFPVGTGLEAIGSSSGVKPRAAKTLSTVVATMGTVALIPTPAKAPVAVSPQVGQLAPGTSVLNVVIYENPNFGGRSRTLGVGGYVLSDFNDVASSIKVPTGLVALLYEQVDAGGGYGVSVDLLEDRPDLSQVNFNDKLSYICVFSSPDPQGFIWARNSVQNGQFVAGHWERQRASGTPVVNTAAVVAPPLPPHPAGAPPAFCGGGPIVRDQRQPTLPNDVANDTDGDGLGDQLEAALGTCASKTSSVPGVKCDVIADTRDTDGDGLLDGWEVLGKWATNSQNKPVFLDLPRWGADPRHKDVFIEVDFRRLNLAENQQGLALRMPPEAARQMAAAYGDTATTDPGLRAAHAASVANPDGLPGIRLHLDTGVPPERPEDATIYGDWGGYNPVDALPTGPQRPEDVWPVQMDRSRHGVFHYVMGYPTGGGSCGGGIACGFNMNSAYVAAHEFGHTMGLDHNGPYRVENEPNCKPHYMSLMSYSYSGYLQFSDGRRNSLLLNNHSLQETNAINPADRPLLDALANVFNYKVDPLAGHVDWNRDGRFSPATARVRAYANYKPGGGGCEFTRQGEQDSGIQSLRSPAVVRYKNQIWMFAVDLNGRLAYSYTSAWNCSPNIDNCPVPKFVQPGIRDIGPISAIDAKTFTVNGVEMIIIVGIRPDGTMFYTWVTVSSTGLNVWDSVIAIDGSSPAAGEPSLANTRDKSSLTLAYKGTDNVARTRGFTGHSWSPEQIVTVGGQPLAVHPNTSPAVAFVYLPIGISPVIGQEHLIGAFTNPQGFIQLYTPQLPGRQWGSIGIPYDQMSSPVGRPVMAWTPGPGDGGVVTTLGAAASTSTLSRGLLPATESASPSAHAQEENTPPPSGEIREQEQRIPPGTDLPTPPTSLGEQGHVPKEKTSSGEVQERAVLRKLPLDVTGQRPLQMAPSSGTTPLSTGRFYILFLEYQVPPPGYPATNATRMAMSYVGPDGKLRIGLNSYFDNVWSYVYGMSLVTPSETALRAAMTYSIHKPATENHVFFRPHADGMADLIYKDYDDWRTLGWGSCVTVAKTQTSSPVKCAPAW